MWCIKIAKKCSLNGINNNIIDIETLRLIIGNANCNSFDAIDVSLADNANDIFTSYR